MSFPNPYAPPPDAPGGLPAGPRRRPPVHPVAWLGIGVAVVSLLGWMVAAGALAVRGAQSIVAAGTLDDAECADLPADAREALDREIMRVTPPGARLVDDGQGCDTYEGGSFFYSGRTFDVDGDPVEALDYLATRAESDGWVPLDDGIFRITSSALVTCLYLWDEDGQAFVEVDVTASDRDDLNPLCQWGDGDTSGGDDAAVGSAGLTNPAP